MLMSKGCCLTFNRTIGIAVLLAIFSGFWSHPILYSVAQTVADIFMSLLKLVSVPVIFLSLMSTISGMEMQEFRDLGQRVIKYTLLTTFAAAVVALLLFLVIDPVRSVTVLPAGSAQELNTQQGYLTYLIQTIPSNIVVPFSEGNVVSVLLLALLFSLAILALPTSNRQVLHQLFSSLYALIMKVTSWILLAIPLAIWSFITLFIRDMHSGLEITNLLFYLACVVLANLVQATVVLPIFLKIQGVAPVRLFRGMWPALSVAFFSKSSSATLPMALRCAEERLGLPKKLSSFSFPLCTALNMNGCAAFILITVLFVSMSNGATFSLPEMALWTVVATIAALGNAGVPMGCYFLSSALLASMNVPLNLLGVILPFYALIDMLETAVNVWSDSCVVAVVDRQLTVPSETLVTSAPLSQS